MGSARTTRASRHSMSDSCLARSWSASHGGRPAALFSDGGRVQPMARAEETGAQSIASSAGTAQPPSPLSLLTSSAEA
eukprot:8940721-Pyramimonas_sp.AAC.1